MLMYHGINTSTSRVHPYFEINTSPEMFAQQMEYLYDRGYNPVTLDSAVQMIDSGKVVSKAVVITFDDGFHDFYSAAMPILSRFGFPATMFVVSNFVGSRPHRFGERRVMSWAELREVQANGIQIGSHTATHPILRNLSLDNVEMEIKKSKQDIEQNLGPPITSFSYPYGFPEQAYSFVASVKKFMEEAGYKSGVTTVLGTAGKSSDRLLLPRIPMNTYDDAALFQAKLDSAYDWLRAPQLAYKMLSDVMPRKRRSPIAGLAT
jgi:peptidoglycan/xylan/chitin deacetylase (PgdA/CDA1 family)